MKDEYIGCECMGLNHVIHFTYFPLEKGERIDPGDDVIYLTTLADSWRNTIWPFFWDTKWKYLKYHFTKDHWKDYYHYSIWAHLGVGIKYIFTNLTDDVIYGDTQVGDQKLDKLYEIMSWLSKEENSPYRDRVEIKEDRFVLSFMIDRSNEDYIFFGTEVTFNKAKFFTRLVRGVKYILGRDNNRELHFEITPDNASLVKGLIKRLQKEKTLNG